MLKETKAEETIVFFVTFLSLVAFQLGGKGGRAPSPPPPGYAYTTTMYLYLFCIFLQQRYLYLFGWPS